MATTTPERPDGAAEASVAASLAAAEAACLRRGVQLTELRRQVLRLVLEAGQPTGAYALLDRLRALRPGAAPPTVYRALDFLLEHGLIHKVERLNAFIGCAGGGPAEDHCTGHGHDHPHQFLICDRCGATLELCDRDVSEAVATAARRAGFAAKRTTVEVEGLCVRCTDG